MSIIVRKVFRAICIAATLATLGVIGYSSYLYNQNESKLSSLLIVLASFIICLANTITVHMGVVSCRIDIGMLELKISIKEREQDAQPSELRQAELEDMRRDLDDLKHGCCCCRC